MILSRHLEMTDNDSQLARELLEYLESDYEGEFMAQPPQLVLINCDETEFNKQRQSDGCAATSSG